MKDLRFGRPSGMVVQGTRVETLPVRPRWEAIGEKGEPVCAICAHERRFGVRLGAHTFRGVIHAGGSW